MIDTRWINRTVTISLLVILLAGAPLVWHFGGRLSELAMAPVAQAAMNK